MGILSGIGTKTALGVVAAGAAYGIYKSHPMKYGINSAFDAMYDNPDVDNTILGRDLGVSDVLPIPMGMKQIMHPIANLKTGAGFMQADMEKIESANQNAVDRTFSTSDISSERYAEYQGSMFPQRSSAKRWNSASGDIVLGSYNLRHS